MKKFFLIAVVASLFSITAQAAERPANYYRPYGHNTRYTRTSESRPTQNYQRQQYRQPSYYSQEVQPQPTPDYRYEQAQYAPYNTFRLRPVVGIDYVYSMVDIGDFDTEDGKLDLAKDKLNAFALSAGLQLNQYVGLEAFYQQSKKAKKTTDMGYYDYIVEDQYKAYGLDLIAYYPVISQLDLIGSLGVAYFKAEVKNLADNKSYNEDKLGFRFGAGLQYYITDYLAFRLMARYNYVNIKGPDDLYKLDNIVDVTAGIRVYF